MDIPHLFIHSLAYGHFSYFQFGLLCIKPPYIFVYMSLWVDIYSFLLGNSFIVGSHDECMFNFTRNCQTVFQSSFTILYPYQQCMRIQLVPHFHQHLIFLVFLILAIFRGVYWYLIVVLICIPLMSDDVEHLFLCLFAIHVSSLVTYAFKFFAQFGRVACPYYCIRGLFILYPNPLLEITLLYSSSLLLAF